MFPPSLFRPWAASVLRGFPIIPPGTMATLVAGFSFTAMIDEEITEVRLIFSGLSVGFNVLASVGSVFTNVHGAGLALHGTPFVARVAVGGFRVARARRVAKAAGMTLHPRPGSFGRSSAVVRLTRPSTREGDHNPLRAREPHGRHHGTIAPRTKPPPPPSSSLRLILATTTTHRDPRRPILPLSSTSTVAPIDSTQARRALSRARPS